MLLPGLLILIFLVIITVLVLRARGLRLAYVWLILLIAWFVVWAAILVVEPGAVAELRVQGFFNIGESTVNLVLKFTELNRPVSFGVIALTIAYLLTSTLTPNGDKSLYEWIGAILGGCVAWMILLAGNPWTLLLAWTALDMFQLVRFFGAQERESEKLIPHHLFKFAGSMLLVYLSARTYLANPVDFFGKPIENLGLILLASSILHTGLIWRPEAGRKREQGGQNAVIFQFLSLTANLFVLTQVDVIGIVPINLLIFKIVLASLSILFALKWHNGKDESENLNALLSSFAAMSGFLFLSSNPTGIVFLLVILLLVASWVFIYSDRFPLLSIFWVIGIFLATSLPYMLGNIVISQLISSGNYMDILALAVPLAFVMAGMVKFSRMQKGIFDYRETLVRGVYTFGLAFPVISAILIITFMVPVTAFNYVSLIATGLQVVLVFILQSKARPQFAANYLPSGNVWIAERKAAIIKIMIQIREFMLQLTRYMYDFFLNLFEGDGGILWSMVLLSLLIAILANQGAGV